MGDPQTFGDMSVLIADLANLSALRSKIRKKSMELESPKTFGMKTMRPYRVIGKFSG